MKLFMSLSIILVLGANQYGWAAPTEAEISERAFFDSIIDSIMALESEPEPSSDQVCYKDLGCFSLHGVMGHTQFLPQSPSHIHTKFFAYQPSHPDTKHELDTYNSNSFNVVNKSKRLAFIIHGFQSKPDADYLINLRHSLFGHAHDIGTVVMVDWEIGAKGPNYPQAAANTELVGRQIGLLLNEMIKSGHTKSGQIHLIGFSLGAQIAGHAGKWSQSQYHWKIDRITGLDAAAPLYENHPGSFLTKSDANFVDGIHTSIGNNLLTFELGFTSAYAHVDFYPNGGKKQPMCHLGSGITCKHRSSVIYFDASLTASCQFKGHSCNSYEEYEKGHCKQTQTVMGYHANRNVHGKMFLDTSAKYPFCDKN